ncbi:WD repeat-containing protein 3 isoform X1 [Parasteatoda tepidariorum]|uniref:WD repeat-containing protein 3 isoform X1 n=1 Tax=Parasteatoda tepidariorum TaxID=114398 RepID=UPI001C723348|nr:WD repeat-containing protein 3 [Parasteatoda tepidariorum]
MTTKQYLRFEPGNIFGLVASSTAKILPVNYSNKNNLFAVPACENIYVWNLQSKEKSQVLAGEKSNVTCFVVDNGCRNITVGYADGKIKVFDLKTGRCEVSFLGHKSAVSCLTYENKGSNLASGGKDCEIVLWNVTDQAGLFRLKGHKGPITKCIFLHPKNVLISSSLDTYIKLWDLDTKHCFHTVVGNRNEILDCVIVKETKLIVGLNGINLKVWNIASDTNEDDPISDRKRLKIDELGMDSVGINDGSNEDEFENCNVTEAGTITTSESKTTSIVLDPSERLLGVHGSTKIVQLYKILTQVEMNKKLRKRKAKEMKRKKNEGDDGDLSVSISIEDEFSSLGSFQLLGKVDSFAMSVNNQDLAKITVLFKNNSIAQYNFDLKHKHSKLELSRSILTPGHRSAIKALSCSSDSLTILSASDESIKVWNSLNEEQACSNTLNCNSALCSVFVPGNNHCIIGTKKGKLEIYDIYAGDLLERLDAHDGSAQCAVLTPDEGGITSGGSDKEVKFWDFELITDSEYSEVKKRLSLNLRRTLKMPDEILCIRYSPDYQKIAVALLDSTVQVLFVDTLKLAFSLYGHALPVTCMDISHDSTLIATGSEDKDVRIWSMEFGSCNKFLKKAHDKGITCINFLPKTHLFFTGSRDNTVKQWDADNFQKIITLKGHQNEVTAITVCPDGSFVVTSSRDKSLRLWNKTREPLVLQEEQEEEEKEDLEATEDLPPIPGEVNKEVALSGMKSEETIKTVDQLIEALKVYSSEVLKLEEFELECKSVGKKLPTPAAHPLLTAYRASTPLEYIRKVIVKVKSSELEGALMYLPFNYVLDFLRILSEFTDKGWETELCEKCTSFLVRIHFGQILTSQNFQPVIEKLKEKLFGQVHHMKDKIGYAKVVSNLQQVAIDAREEVSMFSEVLENVQKKKKKARRKLERPIITYS